MTAAIAGHPHLAPVPDTEPPFDPDRARSGARPGRPVSRAAIRSTVSATSMAHTSVPSWSGRAEPAGRRAVSAQPPPAGRAARVLSTVLVEVLSGRRPVGQMRAQTTPGVFAALAERAPGGWHAMHLSSVRVCQPADGVAEVCAVVRGRERVHAIAFRIEGVDGRWRITALDIG